MLVKYFSFSIAIVLCLVVLGYSLYVAVNLAQTERNRQLCCNKLRFIAISLPGRGNVVPPARAQGHSWRVRLNPFMIADPFFSQYRFDEPWDGDWNHEIESRPARNNSGEVVGGLDATGIRYCEAFYFWQCPCTEDSDSPHTNYLMPVGPGAIGNPDKDQSLEEIADDPATTIFIAETATRDIEWLEPNDFDVETMSFQINDSARPSISSHHPGGAHVLFCDGHVEFLSEDLPPELVKAMITIAGGEKIVQDDAAPGGYRLADSPNATP